MGPNDRRWCNDDHMETETENQHWNRHLWGSMDEIYIFNASIAAA